MSKLKNFDRAQYRSDFDAVVGFIKEGRLDNYDFNVCSVEAFKNALAYLCVNDIKHTYHTYYAFGLMLISIVFGDEYSYSFWCACDNFDSLKERIK